MSITVPQTKNVGQASAGSISASFTSGISAGSIIVVAGMFGNTATGVTLSDGHSDAVTDSGQGLINDSALTAISYVKAFLSPATGAQTITATFTGGTTPGFSDIYIWEVAGLTSAQFDKVVSATGTNNSLDSGSSGTLSSANEACFGYGVSDNTVSAAGSGWTDDGQAAVTGDRGEHKIVSVNTALDATATGTGVTNYRMWFASVMSASADTLAPLPQLLMM